MCVDHVSLPFLADYSYGTFHIPYQQVNRLQITKTSSTLQWVDKTTCSSDLLAPCHHVLHLLYVSCLNWVFWHFWLCFENFSNRYQESVIQSSSVLLWHVSCIDSLQRKLLALALQSFSASVYVWCLLSHSGSIQNLDPPLGSVFWVTEEMWLKPVKRGGKVAAAQTTVRHPVRDGVTQLSCPVSEVNHMKQIEMEYFFHPADVSGCSELLTPLGLFCITTVSLIVSLLGKGPLIEGNKTP